MEPELAADAGESLKAGHLVSWPAERVSRTLFIGLAMIESLAIYCLVVALILLFANPFTAR